MTFTPAVTDRVIPEPVRPGERAPTGPGAGRGRPSSRLLTGALRASMMASLALLSVLYLTRGLGQATPEPTAPTSLERPVPDVERLGCREPPPEVEPELCR